MSFRQELGRHKAYVFEKYNREVLSQCYGHTSLSRLSVDLYNNCFPNHFSCESSQQCLLMSVLSIEAKLKLHSEIISSHVILYLFVFLRSMYFCKTFTCTASIALMHSKYTSTHQHHRTIHYTVTQQYILNNTYIATLLIHEETIPATLSQITTAPLP